MSYNNFWIKYLFFCGIILYLTGSISCSKKVNIEASPPTVVVAPVVEKEVFLTKEFVGEAIAREKILLRARVVGFLIKKNFENGAYVKKGDTIFVIEKDQYAAKLEAAKGVLLQAEADYNNAKIEYDRQSRLIKSNATSQKEYDKAVQNKYATEGALLKAQAQLKTAELNLSYTDIKAPYDGKLGVAQYDVGNLVGPSSDPLAILTMVNPIEIQFAISEALLVTALQKDTKDPGENTNINEELRNQKIVPSLVLANNTVYPYKGEIYFVDNVIDKLTGTINIRALFPNPKHIILPGAYVRVKLSQSNPTKSLLVPQEAVQEDQTGKFVYIVEKNNKVKSSKIEEVDTYNTDYIVSSGVKVGDMIVIEGIQKIKPGITVNPIKELCKNNL